MTIFHFYYSSAEPESNKSNNFRFYRGFKGAINSVLKDLRVWAITSLCDQFSLTNLMNNPTISPILSDLLSYAKFAWWYLKTGYNERKC